MAKAVWNGTVIAESDDTVVVEGNHYFPRESLRDDVVRPSDTHTRLPVEGHRVVLLPRARRQAEQGRRLVLPAAEGRRQADHRPGRLLEGRRGRRVRATVLHAPFDVRLEQAPDPKVAGPRRRRRPGRRQLHLRVRPVALPRRHPTPRPAPHRPRVRRRRRGDRRRGRPASASGDLVIAPVRVSDGTCPHCRHGLQTSCVARRLLGGPTATARGRRRPGRGRPRARWPTARSCRCPGRAPDDACCGRRCSRSPTSWAPATTRRSRRGVRPGRHRGRRRRRRGRPLRRARRPPARRRAGDRDVAARRPPGDRARSSAPPTSSTSAARTASRAVAELTGGVGADAVLECVGTGQSMEQAIDGRPARRDGRLRRRAARRRAADPRDVLPQRRRRRRRGAGARVPARAARRRRSPGAHRPRRRSSTSSCRSTTSPRATPRWTSAARSRCCCAPDGAPRRVLARLRLLAGCSYSRLKPIRE